MASRSSRSPALVAFVLHRYDWSESSLILDLFTRERGRLAAAAKGARRPFSQLRSVLLPFQRIQVSLGAVPADEHSNDIENLRGAEWVGGGAMLTGAALFNGFYLNELLMRLMARHDPHPALFDAYAATIACLGSDDAGSQAALRAFELVLLKEIGVLPDLAIETSTGRRVGGGDRYRLLADAGVVAAGGATDATTGGSTLAAAQAALGSGDLEQLRRIAANALAELRPILRALLHYHLGTDRLRTRQVMLDAQALTLKPTR